MVTIGIRSIGLIVLGFSVLAHAQGPAADGYIVTFLDGTSQAERAAVAQRAGAAVQFNYSIVNAISVRVANPNVVTAMGRERSVISIVPDRAVHAIQDAAGIAADAKAGASGGTGSSGQILPEGVKRVGLPRPGSDGSGIGVAIVDTGIDLNHSDLPVSPNTFSAFFGVSCQDDAGHGTHVSGTVAALDNSTGVLGVAPKATLYCVKVLDAAGNGSDAAVIAGLDWVYKNAATVTPPIRVINMSLGRDGSVGDNPPLRTAVRNLYNAGIAVVVAAGNDASKEVKDMVPASYPEVIAVAATTAIPGSNKCRRFNGVIDADTASYFTTDGAYQVEAVSGLLMGVTISGPGEDKEDISSGCLISSTGILSTRLGGGTTRMSGTSMASPHVAGIAARMLQLYPYGPEGIRAALRKSGNLAQKLGDAPLNSPTSIYTFDNEREGIALAP
jgi:subtilisin family serine protease